jgi:uncharacterized protein YkwD
MQSNNGSVTFSTSPKASQAPSSGDATTWLNKHNAKQAQYGVPALAWSTNLKSLAQSYTNTLAASCTFLWTMVQLHMHTQSHTQSHTQDHTQKGF